MSKKIEPIYDISAELAKEYGEHGTPERAKFDKEAYNFYNEQVALDRTAKKLRSDI